MSHIDRRLSVACPLGQARKRLEAFFRSAGNREGDTLKLSLHVEIPVPGLARAIDLSRSVIATIRPHPRPADMEARYSVQWAAQKPGPFPLFSGEMLVEGGADYDSFVLHLVGTYEPPLGALGGAFDALVGRRLAAATANNLLHQIRDVVERDFEADEERKREAVPGGVRA